MNAVLCIGSSRDWAEYGNMLLDSASNPPKTGTIKGATNDITRRNTKRKEVYPRTKIPRKGTDVGLRTARERGVGDILYLHGRSVLGSVL